MADLMYSPHLFVTILLAVVLVGLSLLGVPLISLFMAPMAAAALLLPLGLIL